MCGMGVGGREVQQGGSICIHIANSIHCTAETNNTVKQLYSKQNKTSKQKPKKYFLVWPHSSFTKAVFIFIFYIPFVSVLLNYLFFLIRPNLHTFSPLDVSQSRICIPLLLSTIVVDGMCRNILIVIC